MEKKKKDHKHTHSTTHKKKLRLKKRMNKGAHILVMYAKFYKDHKHHTYMHKTT